MKQRGTALRQKTELFIIVPSFLPVPSFLLRSLFIVFLAPPTRYRRNTGRSCVGSSLSSTPRAHDTHLLEGWSRREYVIMSRDQIEISETRYKIYFSRPDLAINQSECSLAVPSQSGTSITYRSLPGTSCGSPNPCTFPPFLGHPCSPLARLPEPDW